MTLDTPTSPFEAIRHKNANGLEYWSARELAPLLGYVQWRNFVTVLDKARFTCANSGQAPADHFADTSKMVPLGSGGQRRIADVHLSRYACYLVIQNGDSEKPGVALGYTYFTRSVRLAAGEDS